MNLCHTPKHTVQRNHISVNIVITFLQRIVSHSSYEDTHWGKPKYCNQCDMNFSNNNNLIRHMRMHAGEKPYNCNKCAITFLNKSNLISHMRL